MISRIRILVLVLAVSNFVGTAGTPRANGQGQSQVGGSDYTFVNPYNFVPLHTNPSSREDGKPKSASRWHEELYTGRLKVTMKTVTPLLPIVRVREATDKEPALLTVRRGPDGMPAINGLSIKGMLRSLYEQATGSRLGVFDDAKPLTYRSSTDGANTLVLAKVTENNQAHLKITTSTGIEHQLGRSWKKNPGTRSNGRVPAHSFRPRGFRLASAVQKGQATSLVTVFGLFCI